MTVDVDNFLQVDWQRVIPVQTTNTRNHTVMYTVLKVLLFTTFMQYKYSQWNWRNNATIIIT